MKEFRLEIVTPSKSIYDDMVKSVTFPGEMGEFQVLFNHAGMISLIAIGKIKIEKENGSKTFFATSGGTVEVKDNKVLYLAETAEPAEVIDLERAQNALNRAKERMSSENKQDVDFARAESSLLRAMNRIKVVDSSR
ncbi:MAG: F0F1 ATP synthase subunit epsilon [Ignavibacteria bacterium]|nr:F0F1 ATP synthase subunit epsilon [Ignavibacteria bacterium]